MKSHTHLILFFFSEKNYMFGLLKNIYENVTKSPDDVDPLLASKRIDITRFACLLGFTDCVDRSIRLFQTWMNTTDPDKTNK